MTISDQQLQEFCDKLSAFRMAHYGKSFPREHLKDGETAEEAVKRVHGLQPCTFERGPKFTRIVSNDHSKSVYCFVNNETGDIYKAAGWKAPEPKRHIRGNIAKGTEGLGVYGPAYLR
jgi:hypothetical protein